MAAAFESTGQVDMNSEGGITLLRGLFMIRNEVLPHLYNKSRNIALNDTNLREVQLYIKANHNITESIARGENVHLAVVMLRENLHAEREPSC